MFELLLYVIVFGLLFYFITLIGLPVASFFIQMLTTLLSIPVLIFDWIMGNK